MKKIVKNNKFIDNCILKFNDYEKKRIKAKSIRQKDMAMKIWSRRSTIEPYLVNCWVKIHNGKNFIRKQITNHMVGYKFGQFSFTRSKYIYKKKKKK